MLYGKKLGEDSFLKEGKFSFCISQKLVSQIRMTDLEWQIWWINGVNYCLNTIKYYRIWLVIPTVQCVWVLMKLNGVGFGSGKWIRVREKSIVSLMIRGGVPVLSRPTFNPKTSFKVWERPAQEGRSPIRPPGEVFWPMKRAPDRKVPVVRTTEREWISPPPWAATDNIWSKHESVTLLLGRVCWVYDVPHPSVFHKLYVFLVFLDQP